MQIDNRASNWTHLSSYSPSNNAILANIFCFYLHSYLLNVLFPFFTMAVIVFFFLKYLKSIFATSLSCALGAGREKSSFASIFLLKGTGSYSVWSQCSHYIETVYLICMANQLLGHQCLERSLDHWLRMIISWKWL